MLGIKDEEVFIMTIKFHEDKASGEIHVGIKDGQNINWLTSGRLELDYAYSVTAGNRKSYDVWVGNKRVTNRVPTKKEAKEVLKRFLRRYAEQEARKMTFNR